ncbi:DUF6879 family protein [Streptomyces sp. HB132]|uniref:DUF6879 family protein n=1 Tax=Streptomyces sp. HB132 TaxID=767388 RepID=UPI0035A8A14E
MTKGSSPYAPDEPWFVTIKAQTDVGKTVGRVRIASGPPTTEQLCLFDYARHKAAFGEDIRYLCREDARVQACPPRTALAGCCRVAWSWAGVAP